MKALLLLCSLFIGLGVVAQEDRPPKETLKVKGIILGNVKAKVVVYSYDSHIGEWYKEEEYKHKNNYSIRLNPTLAHKVWFMAENGESKTLYVDPGEGGPWFKQLDVDFASNCSPYAKIYQSEGYKYSLERVDETYDASIRELPQEYAH